MGMGMGMGGTTGLLDPITLPSVNLDGASFIYINAATLVGTPPGGPRGDLGDPLGALRPLARHGSAIRGSCGPAASYSSQLWSACS